MKICPNCKENNPDYVNVCLHCGFFIKDYKPEETEEKSSFWLSILASGLKTGLKCALISLPIVVMCNFCDNMTEVSKQAERDSKQAVSRRMSELGAPCDTFRSCCDRCFNVSLNPQTCCQRCADRLILGNILDSSFPCK